MEPQLLLVLLKVLLFVFTFFSSLICFPQFTKSIFKSFSQRRDELKKVVFPLKSSRMFGRPGNAFGSIGETSSAAILSKNPNDSVFGAPTSVHGEQAVRFTPATGHVQSSFSASSFVNTNKMAVFPTDVKSSVFSSTSSAAPFLHPEKQTGNSFPAFGTAVPKTVVGPLSEGVKPVWGLNPAGVENVSNPFPSHGGGGILFPASSNSDVDTSPVIINSPFKRSAFVSTAFQKTGNAASVIPQAPFTNDAAGNPSAARQPLFPFSSKGYNTLDIPDASKGSQLTPQVTSSFFGGSRNKDGGILKEERGHCFKRPAIAPNREGNEQYPPPQEKQQEPLPSSFSPPAAAAFPQGEGGNAVGKELLATRVFTAFMSNIMSTDESVWEGSEEHIEGAFFGVVGSHGMADYETTLQQMHKSWVILKKLRGNHQPQLVQLPGERWVVLFSLGCYLNLVTSTIQEGDVASKFGGNEEMKKLRCTILQDMGNMLIDCCTYANLLCEICLYLFCNQKETHAPFCILPIVLSRARTVFELACEKGISSVQSNLKSILLKLHRFVRVAPPKHGSQSVVEKKRIVAFAALLSEMMLYNSAPPESNHFVEAFHQHYGDMVNIRCALYRNSADKILQEPLTDVMVHQAMELFARAFVLADSEAKEKRQPLFVKLAACALALGRIPPAAFLQSFDNSGLEDLVVALQSCNLRLFNLAMLNNSELYVRCGVHNVLQLVRKRISLLMVVKYYSLCFSDRIPVQEMVEYFKLPYTLLEACNVWLLPLLVEKKINGVIESGTLVLSSTNPFDEYSVDTLRMLVENTPAW
uniref:Uncharacterized protein n=1 Tax=Trypanosoma congolense (strain IL3000) TaxID=1068625 RepID=G0V0J7_TRYCI|nr:conserved hypothetical protein [Trypanosoma congolense IL3000]